MSNSADTYRTHVLKAHRKAFDFHAEVSRGIARALTIPRTRPSFQRLVLDMLMLQCFKSHATVSLLAQHGLMEDTATIARRLMELSVTAMYIGADSEARVRTRRAGMYLSFMWRELPQRLRRRLPLRIRRQWSAMARRYAHYIPAKARKWGPSFFEMFKEIGREDLYRSDYSFLSSIAHGSSNNQLFTFSASRIRVHDDRFASVLLLYSTRYCLAALEQWNRRFRLVDKRTFAEWAARASSWQHRQSELDAA